MIRLRHLDILRALLALMVLFGHSRMLLWMPWQEWSVLPHSPWELALGALGSFFRFGHEAVMVFFALSGFFIHLGVARQSATGQPISFGVRDYLSRRARRILPPYYAALVFTCLVDFFGRHWFPRLYLAQTDDPIVNNSFGAAGYTLDSVLPALFAQPKLLGIRFGGNGPLWSIGHEVFFYALYPLFMWVWLRNRALAYGTGLVIGWLCYYYPIAGWWSGTMVNYPVWLSGALLAEMICQHHSQPASRWLSPLSAFVALASLWTVYRLPESNPWHLPLNILLGTSAITSFATMSIDLTSTSPGRLLEWLGTRSYSLYAFHFPVIVFLSAWCFQTAGQRPAHGWLALLGGASSIMVGLLAFHLVERHFLPRRHRL